MRNCENTFSFKYLQNKIESVSLPSERWCYTKGNDSFFGFQKIENDATIRKRVAVRADLSAQIFIADEIMPFSKYIKISSIQELVDLLKSVDEYYCSRFLNA